METEEDQREAWIIENCKGDPELLEELRSLFSHHQESGEFLEKPVFQFLEPKDPSSIEVTTFLYPKVQGYEILGLLGEGGMGQVFHARQVHPPREVALKMLAPGHRSQISIQRFEWEIETLAHLYHPNIAYIYASGTVKTEAGEQPYFTMEYVQGDPLDHFVEKESLSQIQVLELFSKICTAVDYAHCRGVVHRDLKPDNILVTKEGRPKILDFGVAKVLSGEIAEAREKTMTGQWIGTPPYMSPEQVSNNPDEIDPQTDVFALGLILYKLLAKELPFNSEDLSTPEGIRRTRLQPFTPLSQLQPNTKGDLESIVHKALQSDRGQRYASAAALQNDIRCFLAIRPISAREDSLAYRLRLFTKRNKLIVSVSTASAILIVLLTFLAFWNLNLKQEEARKVLQLSDLKDLQDLQEDAEALWPAAPHKLNELESWLQRADALIATLEPHIQQLETIRDRGNRVAGEAQRGLVNQKRWSIDLDNKIRGISWLEGHSQPEGLQIQQLQQLRGEIKELETTLAKSFQFEFNSREDAWWHRTLNELIHGLRELQRPRSGLLSQVRQLHELSSTIHEDSISGPKPARLWRQSRQYLNTAEGRRLYGSLELEPQLGLIPLGPDPNSGLLEFAHIASGDIPERNERTGQLQLMGTSCIVLVLIPGGQVLLGSQNNAIDAPHYDPMSIPAIEGPMTWVELSAFFMSKFEMTQGQWLNATGHNPSKYYAGSSHAMKAYNLLNPVEQISWLDCERTLRRLDLSIPTEAQWEYVAREGKCFDRRNSTGDSIAHGCSPWFSGQEKTSLQGRANLLDAFASKFGPLDLCYEMLIFDGWGFHSPVDEFLPNNFGIHDMHGNLWEWCKDTKGSYHDAIFLPTDGERVTFKYPNSRIYRGGCYQYPASMARSSYRRDRPQESSAFALGVRPARSLRSQRGH